MPSFEIPGMPGAQMGMINLNDMLGKAFGQQTKTRRMTVGESYDVLIRYGTFAVVAVIVIGNCSIPILILAGFVQPVGGS